eukprot:6994059-Prymnesium_polylepis.1
MLKLYVAAHITHYITIQSASHGSNALKKERERKSVAPAQAGERDAAMADGRPQAKAARATALYSWVVGASHATSQAYRRAPTMSAHHRPRVRTSKKALQTSHS